MGNSFDFDIGQRHCLQPAQHSEFGVRVTQTVEHHDANKSFYVYGVAGTTKDATQVGEAQFFSDFAQSPDVAQGAGGFKREG